MVEAFLLYIDLVVFLVDGCIYKFEAFRAEASGLLYQVHDLATIVRGGKWSVL